MGAMKNLSIKYEEGRMDNASEAERELVKCMSRVMLAEAVERCLDEGMTEELLNQYVLEAIQAYRINQTNPVLLEPDFTRRCRDWEKKENK